MNSQTIAMPFEVLLVEDNPGDAHLTAEALKTGEVSANLNVVIDGVEALAYLDREGEYADAPRPDLILLDLNLPKKDGREVLVEIKTDERLKHIPVVILTTSQSEEDILRAYGFNANYYITKPSDLDQFVTVMRIIEELLVSSHSENPYRVAECEEKEGNRYERSKDL